MPIFTQSLQRIDVTNPQEALKKMANHIKYIQEQLEFTLLNLDSRNIIEIDTDQTVIGDSTGTTNIGSYIHLTGNRGERFAVGKNANGDFVFILNGKNGESVMYLDSEGDLIIPKRTRLIIDGGEW